MYNEHKIHFSKYTIEELSKALSLIPKDTPIQGDVFSAITGITITLDENNITTIMFNTSDVI